MMRLLALTVVLILVTAASSAAWVPACGTIRDVWDCYNCCATEICGGGYYGGGASCLREVQECQAECSAWWDRPEV